MTHQGLDFMIQPQTLTPVVGGVTLGGENSTYTGLPALLILRNLLSARPIGNALRDYVM